MSVKIDSAYIEITNLCNLNCETCYNRSGLNQSRRELSLLQLEVLIEKLRAHGCRRITFAGGEPCLFAALDQLLALPYRYPEIGFGLTTNGTVFHQKLADVYNTVETFTIQISLDGSCEAVNAKTRGAGSFEKTGRLLDALTDKKRLTLKMVVSKANIGDVEAYFRMVAALGATADFAFINRCGNACDAWEDKAVDSRQKLGVLKLIDRLNEEYGAHTVPPACTSSCPLSETEAAKSVLVKVDGSVFPCQLLYDEKYRICNLLQDGDEALFTGFARIAKTAAARKQADFGCGRCILRAHCKRGCLAMAEYYSGDPLGDDGDCDYRKIQFVGHDLNAYLTQINKSV